MSGLWICSFALCSCCSFKKSDKSSSLFTKRAKGANRSSHSLNKEKTGLKNVYNTFWLWFYKKQKRANLSFKKSKCAIRSFFSKKWEIDTKNQKVNSQPWIKKYKYKSFTPILLIILLFRLYEWRCICEGSGWILWRLPLEHRGN